MPQIASGAEKPDLATQARSILEARCFQCHSHSADRIKGGLVLDSNAGIAEGGDSGLVIKTDDLANSRLLAVINHTDPELQMPAKADKLPEVEIAVIAEWVKTGGKWPEEMDAKAKAGLATKKSGGDPSSDDLKRKKGPISEEERKWWSFQPLLKAEIPGGKPAEAAVDAFVQARLAKDGLQQAPPAARRSLIRRLSYDLTGLPPALAEVEAFVRDPSADAYPKLVERLLASPTYGERWARHWLDLARYADSDGYRIDEYRPTAWRYRDYVIRAFNEDKPYDVFVKEQLAGDELFPGQPDALTATAFLRHWVYEYNNRDVETQWTTILNDITDTTSDVFMGMGLQCARCHDHKFDPLLQKDYYRLQAFFAALRPREDIIVATEEEKKAHAEKLAAWEVKTADIRAKMAVIEAPYRESAKNDAIKKFPASTQAIFHKASNERTPLEEQLYQLAYRQVDYEYGRLEGKIKGKDKEDYLALKRELALFDAEKPAPLPTTLVVTDIGKEASPLFIPKRKSEAIEPGFLTILDEKPAVVKPLTESTGRRAALANWLADPKNPLTARVLVNRIWQQHFGRGLAPQASDFGKLGDKPSHPELLDWLAADFIKHGWSIKHLHRRMVLSQTYQADSAVEPALAEKIKLTDPQNLLYARAPVRRLDAEQIRDSFFSVTGELKQEVGGPGVEGRVPRRSIYTRIMRNTRDPLMDVFDAPLWFNSAASRDTTTTPVQSLWLINSPFMLERAKALVNRLEKEGADDDITFIQKAWLNAFGRMPEPREVEQARGFLNDQKATVDIRQAGSAKAAFLQDKIPYRDGQSAVFQPNGPQSRLSIPHDPALNFGNFTIETYALLRTVYDSGAVRTIAAKAGGDRTKPGWTFGVTGIKSRRKPQTLVMQFHQKLPDGKVTESVFFSDQTIKLNNPYFLAAAVSLASGDKPAEVTFYVKDLTNDDEPMLVAKIQGDLTGDFSNTEPFTLGNRAGGKDGGFDGMLDSVRLSSIALPAKDLLYTSERTNQHTLGYWPFEVKPDVFLDASGHKHDIKPGPSLATMDVDIKATARRDLCHLLLNTNEFLYVE